MSAWLDTLKSALEVKKSLVPNTKHHAPWPVQYAQAGTHIARDGQTYTITYEENQMAELQWGPWEKLNVPIKVHELMTEKFHQLPVGLWLRINDGGPSLREMLVGHMNQNSGVCDCCSMTNDLVVAIKRPLTKPCQYCGEAILRNLALCPHCDKLQSEAPHG